MGFKKLNVCSRREGKTENDKTYWPKIGVIFYNESEGKGSLLLDMFPNERWHVFDNSDQKTADDILDKEGSPF